MDDDVFDQDITPEEPPAPMYCFGLAMDYTPEELGTPLEAIIIVKVMEQGEFGYRMVSTADLHSIEGLGMLRWGQLLMEEGIMNRQHACECEPVEEETTDEQDT
jgi:hypothetical protein